jgi:hypothetical protein
VCAKTAMRVSRIALIGIWCFCLVLTAISALPTSTIVAKGQCSGIVLAYTTGVENAQVSASSSDPTVTHELCLTLDAGLNRGTACTKTNLVFGIDAQTKTISTDYAVLDSAVCVQDFACRIVTSNYQLSSDELVVAKVETTTGGKITQASSSTVTANKLVCYVPICSALNEYRLSSLLLNDVVKKATPGIITRTASQKVNGAFSLELKFTQPQQTATINLEYTTTALEFYAKNAHQLMYYLNSDQTRQYKVWDSAQTNTPDAFNRIFISHGIPIEKITFTPAVIDGQPVSVPITAWIDAIQDSTVKSSTLVCMKSGQNLFAFKPLSQVLTSTYTKDTQPCSRIGTATFTGTKCCFGQESYFSDSAGACVLGRFVNHTSSDKTPLYSTQVPLQITYLNAQGESQTKTVQTFCTQNCTVSFPPIPFSSEYIITSPVAVLNQTRFTQQHPFKLHLLESKTGLNEQYGPLTCEQTAQQSSGNTCSLTGTNVCVDSVKSTSFVFTIPRTISDSQAWIPVQPMSTFKLDATNPGIKIESSFAGGLVQRFDGSYSSVRITFITENTYTTTIPQNINGNSGSQLPVSNNVLIVPPSTTTSNTSTNNSTTNPVDSSTGPVSGGEGSSQGGLPYTNPGYTIPYNPYNPVDPIIDDPTVGGDLI